VFLLQSVFATIGPETEQSNKKAYLQVNALKKIMMSAICELRSPAKVIAVSVPF
jgi:hypothetical protein